MKEKLGDRAVIAEDLGFLTDSVIKLIEDTGYPGMKILQFAFDSREESEYLPSKYTPNCVVYTGTHDNDTIVGWFNTIEGPDKDFAKSYVGITDDADPELNWKFIKSAMASVADTAVIPIQDYLGLGTEARINVPSTLGTNWKWRLKNGACTDELANRMKELAKECDR
jgi:4-alpha-glucanotransferase